MRTQLWFVCGVNLIIFQARVTSKRSHINTVLKNYQIKNAFADLVENS